MGQDNCTKADDYLKCTKCTKWSSGRCLGNDGAVEEANKTKRAIMDVIVERMDELESEGKISNSDVLDKEDLTKEEKEVLMARGSIHMLACVSVLIDVALEFGSGSGMDLPELLGLVGSRWGAHLDRQKARLFKRMSDHFNSAVEEARERDLAEVAKAQSPNN
jgi:hypothetical protein